MDKSHRAENKDARERDRKVITTGPYAIIRHPMYLAATPVSLGSYRGLLMIVPIVIGVVIRLLDEENVLRHNLPGYGTYCDATPYRLIPHVW